VSYKIRVAAINLSFLAVGIGVGQVGPNEDAPEHHSNQPAHLARENGASHQGSHDLVTTLSGVKMLAGGVDGAITPELIPDLVAYRLFMTAVAEAFDATPQQRVRQRAKLARAHLSERDLQQLFVILAAFQARQQQLENSVQASANVRNANEFETQRDSLVSESMADIKTKLSPQGTSSLHELIQAEKCRMTISPLPRM